MSSFEQSNDNLIPTYEEVTAALVEIMAPDGSDTGLGPDMHIVAARQLGIGDLLLDEDSKPIRYLGGYEDRSVQIRVDQTRANLAMLKQMHNDKFASIGIKLIHYRNHKIINIDQLVAGAGLTPTIEDSNLFKDFLTTINPGDIQEVNSQSLLTSVLENLIRDIRGYYVYDTVPKYPPNPPGTDVEVRRLIEKNLYTYLTIEPEYQRLGLDIESLLYNIESNPTEDDVARQRYDQAMRLITVHKTLQNHIEYMGKGLLSEYIFTDWNQLVIDPAEQFLGPGSRQRKDLHFNDWHGIIEFVDKIEQVDRTKLYAMEVRQGLLRTIDTALAKMEGDETSPYAANNRNGLLNIRKCYAGEDFDTLNFQEFTGRRYIR